MKKLFVSFAALLVSGGSILTITNNNLKTNKIYVENKPGLKTNNQATTVAGIYWYQPNVKINTLNDQPFTQQNTNDAEINYYDFVFLKSLKWDKNNKTINSSINNLTNYDRRNDNVTDDNQDIIDYQTMLSLVDANGNQAIAQGMNLVNRYLNNGLLSFNEKGYVPSRKTFFQNSLINQINDATTQTVITTKFNSQAVVLNDFHITDYISINLHWYGIDMILGSKLISPLLIDLINQAIIAEKNFDVHREVKAFVKDLAKYLKKQMFAAAEKLMLMIDEDLIEMPELIAIIDPIFTIIAKIISDKIGDALVDALDESVTLPSGVAKTLENFFQSIIQKITTKIDPASIGFKLELDIHWLIWRSQIHLICIYPPIVPKSIIIPAHPSVEFKGTANILTGTTNDFVLVMNDSDWQGFTYYIAKNVDSDGGNNYLKISKIYNSNVILTNDEWMTILLKLQRIDISQNFAVCLHIVKNNGNGFKVIYSNLTNSDKNNMPLPEDEPYLKAMFISEDSETSFIASNSLIRYLLEIYNWTINQWNIIKNDTVQNPKNYQNYEDWFYYLYFHIDDSTLHSNVSFWTNKINNKSIIIKFWDKFYNYYYLFSKNENTNFENLLSMTTDNTQILNTSFKAEKGQ